MITSSNMLICLFSYNMTDELKTLLHSVEAFCPGFDMIVYDDASTVPETRVILQSYRHLFRDMFLQEPIAKKSSRGRLAQNIQLSYDYAQENGYRYLFLIQDDMQFVRPLTADVLAEYHKLFEKDHHIIQVDPRFLRRLGHIELDNTLHCYYFSLEDDRSSYADVGILDLHRLKQVAWSFEASERQNKVKAHALGLRRVFPYTPIFMHLPYPVIYRKGRRKNKFPSPFVRRGKVAYRPLSAEEITVMDSRPLAAIPYTRELLTPSGLGLIALLHYRLANEGTVFA